jgi:hypothetical protein
VSFLPHSILQAGHNPEPSSMVGAMPSGHVMLS